MEKNVLDRELSKALEELKEKNKYGLNFGVYYTPKNMWVA